MRVYEFTDYREYLRQLTERKEAGSSSYTFSHFAAAAGVTKSFISQVFHGTASLTADHLYAIAEMIPLDDTDCDYLTLLLEIERCQNVRRKHKLLAQRDRLQQKHRKMTPYFPDSVRQMEQASQVAYYLDTLPSIVHMYLTIPEFAAKPASLVSRLAISPDKLANVLRVLEDCGVIQRGEKGSIKVTSALMHLDKGSHIARNHSALFRLQGINHLMAHEDPEDYFLTTSFAATPDIRTRLRLQLIELVTALASKVEGAASVEAFHLNIDLFRL